MKYKHGHGIPGHHTPEFDCWQSLKARCNRKTHPSYPDYGGRGILIFDGWKKDYLAFYNYVGPRPSKDHSLDRINNDGNYEPGNVRWSTRSVQMKNRRYTKAREIEQLKTELASYKAKYGPLVE